MIVASAICEPCKKSIGAGIASAGAAFREAIDKARDLIKSNPSPRAGDKEAREESAKQEGDVESGGITESRGNSPDKRRKSPTFPCANCGTPVGGAFGAYCQDCDKKSQDPKGEVPPNPEPPEKEPKATENKPRKE